MVLMTSLMLKSELGVGSAYCGAETRRCTETRCKARPGTKTSVAGRLLTGGDYAEDAVAVVVRASGEEELIARAVGAAVLAELNGPDVVDLDVLASGVPKRAKKSARLRTSARHWPETGFEEIGARQSLSRLAERYFPICWRGCRLHCD